MASISSPFASTYLKRSPMSGTPSLSSRHAVAAPLRSTVFSTTKTRAPNNRSLTVVAAVGDVSADGTTYLIAGAAVVALVGNGFPCPECDGAGFVRKAGSTLRANAARKDQAQIVCANCNGLGKLNQVDK